MSFVALFDRMRLEHVLSMRQVVSRDEARPTLTGVSFEKENGKLLLVGTDSYRLGVVAFGDGVEVEGSDDSMLVPYADLERAIKFILADLTRLRWKDGKTRIKIGVTGQTQFRITVVDGPPRYKFEYEWKLIDATFPNWRSLMPSLDWIEDGWSNHKSPYRTVPKDTTLPSFNPEYVTDITAFMSPTRATAAYLPVNLATTGQAGSQAHLRPWLWTYRNAQHEVAKGYLLMPVKT